MIQLMILNAKVYISFIVFLQISFCCFFSFVTVMLDKRLCISLTSCLLPVEVGSKTFDYWVGVKNFRTGGGLGLKILGVFLSLGWRQYPHYMPCEILVFFNVSLGCTFNFLPIH